MPNIRPPALPADDEKQKRIQEQIAWCALDPAIPHCFANQFYLTAGPTEARIAFGVERFNAGANAEMPVKFGQAVYMSTTSLRVLHEIIGRTLAQIDQSQKAQKLDS